MPIGELIAGIGLRLILEAIFYGLFYWVGFLTLKVVSLGIIKLAPLSTIDTKNRSKKGKKRDWGLWLHRPMQGKALKAEAVCTVGAAVCGLIGYFVYLTSTSGC